MMKQTLRFMTVPKSFWDNEQLSLPAKWIAITIDSYTDNPMGVAMGVRAIQTATNLSAKEVKEALTELADKGCLQVNLDQDGQKLLKVLLYKDRYVSSGEHIVVGDKPTDIQILPYDEIAEKWAEICVTLPKITRWSPHRKNKLRSVLKQADLGVEDLYKVFRLISTSCFLNGTKSDQWSCSFDWLIKSSSNIIKVLEGNYHKDYNEQRIYKDIMNGLDISKKTETSDDFYR